MKASRFREGYSAHARRKVQRGGHAQQAVPLGKDAEGGAAKKLLYESIWRGGWRGARATQLSGTAAHEHSLQGTVQNRRNCGGLKDSLSREAVSNQARCSRWVSRRSTRPGRGGGRPPCRASLRERQLSLRLAITGRRRTGRWVPPRMLLRVERELAQETCTWEGQHILHLVRLGGNARQPPGAHRPSGGRGWAPQHRARAPEFGWAQGRERRVQAQASRKAMPWAEMRCAMTSAADRLCPA